jgi:hypothetical protein
MRSITIYTLQFWRLTAQFYAPASHLNYYFCSIRLTNYTLTFQLYNPYYFPCYSSKLTFTSVLFFLTILFLFLIISDHLYFYFLSLFFILASYYPSNTYFFIDIFKPLAQNLIPPNLCSFTSQYVAPAFLFATSGANPLLIFSPLLQLLHVYCKVDCLYYWLTDSLTTWLVLCA